MLKRFTVLIFILAVLSASSSQAQILRGVIRGLAGVVSVGGPSLHGTPVMNKTGNATASISAPTTNLSLNDVVVVFAGTSGGITITGISDDASVPNTYTLVDTGTADTPNFMKVFLAPVTTAKTGATITATTGAGTDTRTIQVFVVSGLASKAVDQHTNYTGGGIYDFTGSTGITTTVANSIVLAAWENYYGGTPTIPAPWTVGPNTDPNCNSEYQIVAATGTYKATATNLGGDHIGMVILNLK